MSGHKVSIDTNLKCGFVLDFKNEKCKDLWLKLHKKKCELCNKNLHKTKNILILNNIK